MEYSVRKDLSTLGSAHYPTSVQSALVTIEDKYSGLRVFLGGADLPNEEGIYQNVAGLGNEVNFDFVERLYLAMKEGRERKNR